MYKIVLINKKTKEVFNYEYLNDYNLGEKLYFKFEIDTTQLADGEYHLHLYDENDELITTDTLSINNFNLNGIQYEKGENIYVETIIDAKTQTKQVEIKDVVTTVYPDDGYNVMTQVDVDAQQVYDNGYTQGKEQGKQDGIEEQKSKLSSITIEVNGEYSNEDGYNEITVDVQPNLQEKYVNVTDNNTTVTADEEFDGMKSVEINATPVYNNAYNVGKSDGIEEQKEKLSTITINSNGTYNKEDGYNKVTVDVKVQSYSYLTNTVDEDGLRQLGWSDDDINYFKDNNLHYEWENDSYNVTPENIALKDKINNLSDLKNLKTDLNFIYAPYVDAEGVSEGESFLSGAKNLKAIPLYNFRIFRANSMFASCTNLTSIPPLNTSKATNMNNMFYNCTNLTSIPLLDTSNVANMSYMFSICSNLTSIPLLNTSNVATMNSMFSGCSNLTSIPLLNTSNVATMNSMFSGCSNLTTIPPLDTSKATDMAYMFNKCTNLTSIPLLDASNVTNINTFMGYSDIKTLTDLGGFKNLKIDWNDGYGLAKCPNLTKESVMNVINNLYDFRRNGDSTTTKSLKLGTTNMAKLTDEDKAIATNKGWTLTN